MLHNFQLAVIVGKGNDTRLRRIPLVQALQDALAADWQDQFDVFMADIEAVEFDPGYTLEPHERFRIENFEMPPWLANESSMTIQHLESINDHEHEMGGIRGVAGFARDDDGGELVLFQNFSRSHVIQPGRFLFMQQDTYESADRPGMTLGHKLCAVLRRDGEALLFDNFRNANTFLPLADYFEEASEQEIRDLLVHERLAPENIDALAQDAPQWFRKRFAMLRRSGLLDQYSAAEIWAHAQGYEVDVQLDGDRIVFPAEKPAAKRLLQFLNEELFRGAITETLYETNSKREAG